MSRLVRRTCDACQRHDLREGDIVACGMAPSGVFDPEDVCISRHPYDCLRVLCRQCAKKPDPSPFRPCQSCFTPVDHEQLLWCATCSERYNKTCRACHGLLCSYCTYEDTKTYGLLCNPCLGAMMDAEGRMLDGVVFYSPPWPRFSPSQHTIRAVKKLHHETQQQQQQQQKQKQIDGDDTKLPSVSRKRPATAMEPSSSSVGESKWVFVLVHSEGGPYREMDAKVVGVYSTKMLAVDGAKKKYETLSNGFYVDGEFTEPEIFEKVEDRTVEVIGNDDDDDDTDLLYQKDHEGEWSKISLSKKMLDE